MKNSYVNLHKGRKASGGRLKEGAKGFWRPVSRKKDAKGLSKSHLRKTIKGERKRDSDSNAEKRGGEKWKKRRMGGNIVKKPRPCQGNSRNHLRTTSVSLKGGKKKRERPMGKEPGLERRKFQAKNLLFFNEGLKGEKTSRRSGNVKGKKGSTVVMKEGVLGGKKDSARIEVKRRKREPIWGKGDLGKSFVGQNTS